MSERPDDTPREVTSENGIGNGALQEASHTQAETGKDRHVTFWEEFPDAAAIEVFREIKVKKPDKSGAIMYYIMAMNDPANKFLRHLPKEKRSEELRNYYGLAEREVKLKIVSKAEQWFVENWLTPPERLLMALNDKLLEAERVYRNDPITSPEDLVRQGAVIDAFGKYKEAYDRYSAAFRIQEQTKAVHGGGRVSAAERGVLFKHV